MTKNSSQEKNKNVTARFRINEKELTKILDYVNVHKNELGTLSNLCRVAIFEYMEKHK